MSARRAGIERLGWRERVPRLLLPLVLLALIAALLWQYRLGLEAARETAALETSWSALRALGPDASAALETTRAAAVESALAALRVRAEPARLTLFVALGLAALALALLGWALAGSARRRRQRALADDGRTRREQAAILRLLDEIAPLAGGDLRVRATVSEAMTGALADAFNHAVAELRWLVGTVDRSAVRVDEAVRRSRDSAQELVSACTVQAREIHRSSNHLSAMSGTMAQLSAHAAESSRIAEVSVAEAEAGTRAIAESVARLSRIREQAELATRLMERLAGNATAIDEHVETIRDVARRTDLLALNTTIRAAASAAGGLADEPDATGSHDLTGAHAPSAASDLSRLSDEVTRLADLLGGTARDIAALAGTIRQDAEDTTRAMAATNDELASGLAQVERASGSLGSIEAVSRELQGLVREMAEKVLHQSSVVHQLSSNMGVINRITADTSLGVQATAGALEELQAMAVELRNGIADFRLPPPPRDADGTIDATTDAAAARAATRAAMALERTDGALEHG